MDEKKPSSDSVCPGCGVPLDLIRDDWDFHMGLHEADTVFRELEKERLEARRRGFIVRDRRKRSTRPFS